ncbi:MAG: hypothetical protein WC446_06340, partial [Candidatus Paceibacterota bacterium]
SGTSEGNLVQVRVLFRAHNNTTSCLITNICGIFILIIPDYIPDLIKKHPKNSSRDASCTQKQTSYVCFAKQR